VLRFSGFHPRPRARIAQDPQCELPLRPKTFEVLKYLATSGGRLVDRNELLGAVWGKVMVTDDSLAQCISEIRRALGAPGHSLIQTVPRRGYRFCGAVSSRPPWAVELREQPAAVHPTGETGSIDSPAIAVLPFENLSEDPGQRFLSDGVTEDLLTELSRFSDLRVISRNSSFRYRGKHVDVRQIGRRLGARYLLEGSIRRSDSRIRLNAQLVDTATGAQVWADRYDRDLEDLLAVQDELARTIAAVLAVRVTRAEAERVLSRATRTWSGYESYLRALEAFRKRGRSRDAVREARRLVSDALEIDPENARAHALLSKIEWWTYVEPLDGSYLDANALQRAGDLRAKPCSWRRSCRRLTRSSGGRRSSRTATAQGWSRSVTLSRSIATSSTTVMPSRSRIPACRSARWRSFGPASIWIPSSRSTVSRSWAMPITCWAIIETRRITWRTTRRVPRSCGSFRCGLLLPRPATCPPREPRLHRCGGSSRSSRSSAGA
jgi:TolB-like protein